MVINDNGEQEPFQVFAAIGENILNKKVTGLLKGQRTYSLPACEKGEFNLDKLTKKASKLTNYARMFYEMGSRKSGKFDVVIRSINSKDARTASVTKLPIDLLNKLKEKILKIPDARAVYFDVTPKPPGTIEYV